MARARLYDREIVALALPALGALAAEPLYLLADTAIVGHLGTTQLAALALAATALGALTTIFNFLVYGTTSQVARAHGGGDAARAHQLGSQAVWLGLALRLRAGGRDARARRARDRRCSAVTATSRRSPRATCGSRRPACRRCCSRPPGRATCAGSPRCAARSRS